LGTEHTITGSSNLTMIQDEIFWLLMQCMLR